MKDLHIMYVPVEDLHPTDYNPRIWDTTMEKQLTESMSRFGMVDPLIVNGAQERKNVIIGGHFRWHIAKQIGLKSQSAPNLN